MFLSIYFLDVRVSLWFLFSVLICFICSCTMNWAFTGAVTSFSLCNEFLVFSVDEFLSLWSTYAGMVLASLSFAKY